MEGNITQVINNEQLNGKTLKDLLNDMLTYNSAKDIIDTYEDYDAKGFIFEAMWDLVIKFGCCDKFPRKKYEYLYGNFNTESLKPIKKYGLQRYLESSLQSGNRSGWSDISVKNKKGYILMSSKFYRNDSSKSVKKYDIEFIMAVLSKKIEYMDKKNRIYLLVRNRNKVRQLFLNANKSSDTIVDPIINRDGSDNILDLNDLEKYIKELKEKLRDVPYDKYDENFLPQKDDFKPRFHQRLGIEKTSRLIKEGNKKILWGDKCRSGKAYKAGGLILKESKGRKRFSALIITPCPSETMTQFTEDLFRNYKDFNMFEIIEVDKTDSLCDINEKRFNIVIVSKQRLERHREKNEFNVNFDILFFDEDHFAGTTKISEEIINMYSTEKTVKIYLSATYNKCIKKWRIPENCQLFWTIEDEKLCKDRNIEGLKEKHGDIVEEVYDYLSKEKLLTDDDIFSIYDKCPEPIFITNLFDGKRYQEIMEEIENTVYGFSFPALFFIKKGAKRFKHEDQVQKFLRYISGSYAQDYPEGDKSILGRINNIATEYNSRNPTLKDSKSNEGRTQLWFLPERNIANTSSALEKLLTKDKVLKDYDVICVHHKNKEIRCIKDDIERREKEAKKNGKLGLIILAGKMLNLGATLKNCDIVMLMNNSMSSDRVIQQCYRCMTESENGNKKCGFIVDLNQHRVVNLILELGAYRNLNAHDTIKYELKAECIKVDPDFCNKESDFDELTKKLLDVHFNNPSNSLDVMFRGLEDLDISKDMLKKLKDIIGNKKSAKLAKKTVIHNESQDMPFGLQKIPIDGKEDEKEIEKEKIEEKELIEEEIDNSLFVETLSYCLSFVAFLTYDDNIYDFVDCMKNVEENDELIEIFKDQSKKWWDDEEIYYLILEIIEENELEFRINNIFEHIKRHLMKPLMKNPLDNPKKLIEFINKMLKPKEKEKRENAEVFTPLKIVDDMYNDIEKYVPDIFKNPKRTIFDQSAGIGNFPTVAFYRLMDGLKDIYPDKKKREKHIITKQLYMAELNKKNVKILRTIFGKKANIYQGDSLKLDTKKVWGIEKFDLIVGNPPYNKPFSKNSSTAQPLYNEFVEKYINKSRYMSFIIPSRWFAGGNKALEKFRKFMLRRKDIVFIRQFNSSKEAFPDLKTPIQGSVNYFFRDSAYNGKTKFMNDHKSVMIKLDRYDILVPNPRYYSIIDKLRSHTSISELYMPASYYGVGTDDKRLTENNGKGKIKCYVSKTKGYVRYIDKKYIKVDYDFWKVITPRAAHKEHSGFGRILIANPKEISSNSYMFFKVDDEEEAKSLESYLHTKLANFMLSLRKISQDITDLTLKWIPLPPLDRIWTDRDIYEYFDLSMKEIKTIKNAKIKTSK